MIKTQTMTISQGVQILKASLGKLLPQEMSKNFVMFIVWGIALVSTILWIYAPTFYTFQIMAWLWITVLASNFAQAWAESRGKKNAQFLKSQRKDMGAKRRMPDGNISNVSATDLALGEIVCVEAGDLIPCDGEVIEGVASIDESAITGESAPVIREGGGDRSSVTCGTRVLSDSLIIRVTAVSGKTFLDRMIALIEGAVRQKTPSEMVLNSLLVALTFLFIGVAISLGVALHVMNPTIPLDYFGFGVMIVALIPTTIGGLLPAIGISGINRLLGLNVLVTSGRAVEAAGDVDVLLIDKTGTITYGNRFATDFLALEGVDPYVLARASYAASLGDDTPEGKSILALALKKFGKFDLADVTETIPFSAHTRMSGVDLGKHKIRKGATQAILKYLSIPEDQAPSGLTKIVEVISRGGGTPLVVTHDSQILGVIQLKDVLKEGMKERFRLLHRLGIKTIMITGDNPLTASVIAAEAGVDDFLAQATPERKLEYIKSQQALGKLVAMGGDGTNDAPALAQADVGIAMNSGTSAAKEAGNMIDLDSNPTKLIEIVEVGKELLITRGALTTFSIANDVAKYFTLLPCMLMSYYPPLSVLNIMHLQSSQTGILATLIFNLLVMVALIPLALKGVKIRPMSSESLLRHHLILYGIGGIITPFIGIKLIDLML